jgi:peroxiredoxin-like protein
VSVTHLYDVQVAWENDRKGLLSSKELNQNIEVVTPPEFPKGIAGVWSPEHLFVAAINSCLMTTFLAIAENSKLEFTSFSSDATGKLEMIDGKYLMSEVNLYPKVVVNSGVDKERVERILNKSEAACLISNSIKSKINFFPEVIYN